MSSSKPTSKLKKRSASDIAKGTHGPRYQKDLEAFLLYTNEDIISKIVERTNEQMRKVPEKITADEFLFRYSDTKGEEIK